MKRFRARGTRRTRIGTPALFGRVNQYYFTGTMQDGVLLIPRDGEPVFCVPPELRAGGRRVAVSQPPPDEKVSATPCPRAGGSGRGRSFTSKPSWFRSRCSSVSEAFPLQGGGIAGCASRPGAVGKKSVRAGHYGTMRRIHRRIMEDRVPAMLRER